MSDPESIERDLREYLAKEPNLSRQDRLLFLKTVFHKHLEINNLEHKVTYNDLFLLFGEAKSNYVKTRLPMFIGTKKMDGTETVYVCVLEAFIGYLNRMKLLRKNIKFDYKQDYKE